MCGRAALCRVPSPSYFFSPQRLPGRWHKPCRFRRAGPARTIRISNSTRWWTRPNSSASMSIMTRILPAPMSLSKLTGFVNGAKVTVHRRVVAQRSGAMRRDHLDRHRLGQHHHRPLGAHRQGYSDRLRHRHVYPQALTSRPAVAGACALLLPACGEKVGMRGPLRWERTSGGVCNAVACLPRSESRRGPLTLASLDLSPRSGER